MPSKKTKIAIGASVGAVVLAAAIGVTVYFATKKGGSSPPGPGPVPSVTWTCVNDGQGSYMLLSNGQPCAKYNTSDVCSAAATAGTVSCSCPSSPLQVLQGSLCVPVCLDTATWDDNQNKCICPSNEQFDTTTSKCERTCNPPLNIDPTTGDVTGFFNDDNVCTDATKVTTDNTYLDKQCQSTLCQVPSVCTANTYFGKFDSSNHKCTIPNACNGKPFYYTWPDGANTCPGLTYTLDGSSSNCIPPDNGALQVACEFSTGGCPTGMKPLSQGEQCSSGGSGSSNVCRSFTEVGTCPAGYVLNPQQCPPSTKGSCYNETTNSCAPAQYACVAAGFPCPANTGLAASCASSPLGPCLNAQNVCVPTLVGCRPDAENWSFNNGICTNVTIVTGLSLVVDPTSTVNEVIVKATVTLANYSVPLSTLQFRYVLSTQGSVPNHWSGIVSVVSLSSTNPKEVSLTFYPDQSVSIVPSDVTLNLVISGLTLSADGSWVPSISSPDLTEGNVATCKLLPATPGCLPTVNFELNRALQLVPQLSNLSPTVQSTVKVTDAASQLGLSNASTVPYQNAGSFAGAVVPIAVPPSGSQGVSEMFVILAWTPLSTLSDPVTYVVNKNNTALYKGPLTTLVDTVAVNATNSVTYSVVAQTSSCTTSQPQFTTCPALEYQGAMCTSIKTGSSSVINFMIPDPQGSGCINIPSGNEGDAAYYSCVYLQNKSRSLSGVQFPSSSPNYSECLSVVPMTDAQVVVPLKENVDANGLPTGFCTDASCAMGYSNLSRTAVCSCDGSPDFCNEQKDVTQGLPYLRLKGTDGLIESRSASEFASGLSGMSTFLAQNPKLRF